MFTTTSLLLFFFLSFKFLSDYIKTIRTGDPNESDLTYWMFSYDFKSSSKDWVPEDAKLRKRKRTRNTLVFVLYLNAFCIFDRNLRFFSDNFLHNHFWLDLCHLREKL